jgi:NAD(P)H-dependent FMN reductase
MATQYKHQYPRLLALAGSLRKDSYNRQLVAAAAEMARALGAEVIEVDLRDYALPMFDEDLEAEGVPARVRELKQLFADADGLLIASPEYNGSVTAALKNAIDWVSRPDPDPRLNRLFRDKRTALFATSPGGLGGLRGLNHLRDILQSLGAWITPTMLAVPSAMSAFATGGSLADTGSADKLRELVEQTVAAARTAAVVANPQVSVAA